MNPFKIIEGKYPTYAELADFTELRWMTMLQFFSFFIVSYENSEKWVCNSNKIEEMEAHLSIENHPFHEFIYRMGQWKGTTTPKKFQFKLNGMAMHTLVWIKKHPAVVSEEMGKLIKSHPQKMAWCLEQFKVKETLGGQEIVARDNTVKDGITTRQISLPSVQAKVMTSMVKVADMVETLANSISSSQLKGMDIEDKLKHIEKLMPIITQVGKAKMVGNSFTQINLNGSIDEQEKAMLNYINKTNE